MRHVVNIRRHIFRVLSEFLQTQLEDFECNTFILQNKNIIIVLKCRKTLKYNLGAIQ